MPALFTISILDPRILVCTFERGQTKRIGLTTCHTISVGHTVSHPWGRLYTCTAYEILVMIEGNLLGSSLLGALRYLLMCASECLAVQVAVLAALAAKRKSGDSDSLSSKKRKVTSANVVLLRLAGRLRWQ